MIELLVAVLVMGVGVLGVTGMQLLSLQNNQAALLRAEAVQFAYDILDRIRVNPGTGAVPGIAYDGVNLAADPTVPTDCHANNCTPAQMVTFDISVWKCSLGGFNQVDVCGDLRTAGVLPPTTAQPGLPDGDGSIAIDGAGTVTVVVQWNGFDNQPQTITIESQG